MLQKIESSILKTVLYADIFNYPLRKNEVYKWLIGHGTKSEVDMHINGMVQMQHKEGFYFLKERSYIVEERKKRQKISIEKWEHAKKVANILRYIPFISCIGVSGALSLDNASYDDDIDFFIITTTKNLWLTRCITIFILDLFRLRRHPRDQDIRNKICLNMFVDENNLSLPRDEQDLYTAHEIVQMKPLVNKKDIYERFLHANKWIRKFLPNFEGTKNKALESHNKKISHNCIFRLLYVLEFFSKKVQLWYMHKRITSEVIQPGIVRFHPNDARIWIMQAYKNRLGKHFSSPLA